ncbi:MAG: DUF2283 domain-containing protein [Planctomycetes bacterium]|nr:DUF2283 domain-containing protein [Planctomycetota bacterium]
MSDYSLEVTFREGRPTVAYLCVRRSSGEKSCRTKLADPGLVIDFNRQGKAIGVEILAPSMLTLRRLNRLLRDLGLPTVKRAHVAPLWGPKDHIQDGRR